MKTEKMYLTVYVTNMDRAIGFYKKTFGLEPREQSPEWSELGWANAVLGLHHGGKGEPVETGLGFEVDDINAACEAVKTAGGKILQAPEGRPNEPIVLAKAQDTEGNGFTIAAMKH